MPSLSAMSAGGGWGSGVHRPDLIPSARRAEAFILREIKESSSTWSVLSYNASAVFSDPGINRVRILSEFEDTSAALKAIGSITSESGLASKGKIHSLVATPVIVIVIVAASDPLDSRLLLEGCEDAGVHRTAGNTLTLGTSNGSVIPKI